MGPASAIRTLGTLDRVLIALAAVYYLAAAVVTVLTRAGTWSPSAFQSSAERIGDGELQRLLSSALVVAGSVAGLQIALGVLTAGLFILLEGPRLWWAVALVGNCGSALIAYAIIGVSAALGSGSAEAAADEPDFGVSCVLAATLGGLLASGLGRHNRWVVALAVLGLIGLLPVSFGWLDIEHPLAYALGALVVHVSRTARAGSLFTGAGRKGV